MTLLEAFDWNDDLHVKALFAFAVTGIWPEGVLKEVLWGGWREEARQLVALAAMKYLERNP